MPQQLQIQVFALGPWMTNCFVIYSRRGGVGQPCWIVDAGFEPQPMIRFIDEQGLSPRAVLLTHAHLDHIAGLSQLRVRWPDLPILVHPAEREFLAEPELNLSALMDDDDPITAPSTGTLEHGQHIEMGGLVFEVRHTPGHSPGGIALYQAEAGVAIVGDTLFAAGIGRSDFPTSDGSTLMQSIRKQLLTMPDSTRVFPGHGPATTMGAERATNPYLRG